MLGPVLFLIFINHMPLQLQTDTDIYADDTVTHTAGKKLEVVEPKQQISADDFNTWCIENNIGVHCHRCVFLCILQWGKLTGLLTSVFGSGFYHLGYQTESRIPTFFRIYRYITNTQ